MAASEGGELPVWAQAAAAAAVFVVTAVGAVFQFIAKRAGDEPVARADGTHMVVEQAELADMRPLRDLNKKLEEVYKIVEDNHEILDLLRKMQADLELDRRLKQERDFNELRQLARDRGEHGRS